MNEIEKLIRVIDEEHDRSKKPAKFFWWLFILGLSLALGILAVAVTAWVLSSAH
jgi:hypothetical protein